MLEKSPVLLPERDLAQLPNPVNSVPNRELIAEHDLFEQNSDFAYISLDFSNSIL